MLGYGYRLTQPTLLPIDNNPVENCIRPIALGKKNWLFAESERAGQRAAIIQTLIGTAKRNGLDPSAWLKDTLEKLPNWPNSLIDELLPFSQEGAQCAPYRFDHTRLGFAIALPSLQIAFFFRHRQLNLFYTAAKLE